MRLKIIILVLLMAVFGGLVYKFITRPADEASSGTASPAATTDPKKISDDQLVSAYVALATLAESTPIGTPEYEREKTRVLGAIGIEPGQLEKTLAEYNEHPEQWRPIWDRIQEELAKRSGEQGGSATPKGSRDSS